MNYLDDRDYEDVSFIKKHPEIKGVFITIAVLVISFSSVGLYKFMNPPKEDKRTAVPIELREVGKLVCAEQESTGKKDISEPVKLFNFIPMGYLKQDSYEENFNRQSKLRPITEKEFNAKVVELEKELDKLANSNDSQSKAKKSFEKRYTKMIHNLGSYKNYEVRFKYA